MGSDAEVFVFDHAHFVDEVVPALVDLVQTATIGTSWLAWFAAYRPDGMALLRRHRVEQLRTELAQVRREAAEERAALRQEVRDQLAAVLTQLGTGTSTVSEQPARATTEPAPHLGRRTTTDE